VAKRDGRREWLRAAKIARSIHLALNAAGVAAPAGSGIELAQRVLTALWRERSEAAPLPATRIAAAVVRQLVAAGLPAVALQYERAGAELRRRRLELRAVQPAARATDPIVARRGIAAEGR
jgi:hypothetical protein